MASSKVVTTNADLPRQSTICPSSTIIADHNDLSKTLGSMSMDDLLKSIYSSEPNPNPNHDLNFRADGGGASISRQGSLSLPKEMGAKTVDEVWKEIVEGGSDQRRAGAGEGDAGPLEGMSLEDFLTKAGAVREEDVRGLPTVVADPRSCRVDAAVMNGGTQFPMTEQTMEGSSVEGFGNGDGAVVGGAGRGKRRAVEEPVDKATLQKQRRMIKNRESAARSRERKQAYTVELESLVTQLEEENARLLSEEAEMSKQRLKQLMKCIIPVVEMRKPRSMLRRVSSVQW